MVKHIGITEARKEINNLANHLKSEDTVSVTKRGKGVLAIIPWETYEAITETLEIISDTKGFELLKKGIEDYKNERIIDWDEALKNV